MKLGLLLPQLRDDFSSARAVATKAESEDVDGLFGFDHLWLPGHPDVASLPLFPLLTAAAEVTKQISLGTLIARVDTTSIDTLMSKFLALRETAGDRIIAGLGTGDRMTAEEDAYAGVPHRSYEARLELLDQACGRLRAEGFPVWLAGSSEQVTSIAQRHQAQVHLWAPTPDRIKNQGSPFTWGGVLSGSVNDVRQDLVRVQEAGAMWAVCGCRGGLDAPGAFVTLTQANASLR